MKQSKKILIIEDENTLTQVLELKLSRAGFIVRVAYDGEDGLAQLEKEVFDLILLDILMPKIDGFGVLKRLMNLHVNTPVIVLSNLGQEKDIQRIKALGANNFFIKSNTSINVIIDAVKKLLR